MKLGILTKVGLAAAVATVAFASAPTADAGPKVRWKLHSAYGTNLAVLGRVPGYIADQIRAMSGGDFDIQVLSLIHI